MFFANQLYCKYIKFFSLFGAFFLLKIIIKIFYKSRINMNRTLLPCRLENLLECAFSHLLKYLIDDIFLLFGRQYFKLLNQKFSLFFKLLLFFFFSSLFCLFFGFFPLTFRFFNFGFLLLFSQNIQLPTFGNGFFRDVGTVEVAN